jgi:hypothetical protein
MTHKHHDHKINDSFYCKQLKPDGVIAVINADHYLMAEYNHHTGACSWQRVVPASQREMIERWLGQHFPKVKPVPVPVKVAAAAVASKPAVAPPAKTTVAPASKSAGTSSSKSTVAISAKSVSVSSKSAVAAPGRVARKK